MKKQGIVWMMAVLGAVRVLAAPEIVGFGWNGVLVGSNLTAGTTAAVEWASSPAGPWARSWDELAAIPVGPSGVITAAVPFFYRLQDAVPPVVVTTTTTTSSTTSTTTAPFAGLEAGDIAIIGYSCDAPDSVHWVNLVDLPAGITIYFTQNGYSNAPTAGFSNTESGDNFSFTYPESTPAGTIRANLSWQGLSDAGDNIFVYKDGFLDTANLLYGLVANGSTTGWGEDVPSAQGTDLPPTLTDGVTAVAIVPEIDNAHFNTAVLPAGGSRAQWLAAIGNRDNWTGNNASPTNLAYPTGSIVVTTVDTPTTTSTTSTTAPPVLPGDLAVIRVDAIDENFTVVVLRALNEAQTAYWTDNGWKADNTFRDNEGAGTTDIITANYAAGDTFDVATSGLNNAGEQLFLFRGTVANPALIYGLQWGSADGWVDDATSAGTSADPAVTGGGLTADQTVELGLGARWIYEGPLTGTAAALLSAIANPGNWSTNDATAWTGGSFNVTVEP